MASDAALVTFLLHSIHGVGSVDLYGSWDNFSTAYPMQKDRQQAGHWFGCPDFKHVICHGDPSNCSMPQDRPLKMGATYWYFYRKNGSDEFFNKAEPSTNSCPLLPGQTVNIIELPILTSSSFLNTKTLTLQPDDRWSSREPPRKAQPARLSAAGPSSLTQSRAIWHSRAFGRLHTAIVEYALSGFEAMNASCTAQRRPSRRLQDRRVRSAPGPRAASPARDAEPLTPLPKLNVPKQTTPPPRRPALPWRPSDSYINPFRPDTATTHHEIQDDDDDDFSDVLDDEEYDLDGFAASADGSRPLTWSCSFPHVKKQTQPRPRSMPALQPPLTTQIVSKTPPIPEQLRDQSLHANDTPLENARRDLRPERLSLEPLRLPEALHDPLLVLEETLAPALTLAFAPPSPPLQKPLTTDGALFPSATLLPPPPPPPPPQPPIPGPADAAGSPTSMTASSYPEDSHLSSVWPLPPPLARAPRSPALQTMSRPASPAPEHAYAPDRDREHDCGLRTALFSSQGTARLPPLPPVPEQPSIPMPSVKPPRSAGGGRVRDLIASLEGRGGARG